MTQTALFWDKISKKYAAKPVADEEAYQKKLAMTQAYLTHESKVLEFACGTGSTALVHAPLVSSYTAIDISPKMVEICKNKLSDTEIHNLEFKVATLDDYRQFENEYDVILGLSILHLLSNYKEVIAQTFKMLKPGGIFVSNTGCLSDHMAYMRFILPLMKLLGLAPHVEFFSRKELEQSMLSSGFIIEKAWLPPKSKTSYFVIARKPES
ncbi:class I SAM-dependent methyltransferase [Aliikangiella sp. G2MR2-5]|uniref:class I SAM-dependent methyltransferase n=1 Tax=Aliikangiella sp. G2MR2-5 TaxID=2788943 RepID=UPI0018AB12B4|nr:class I SAM-dependent methyltransferase [Aliikangiella sp. G2MR2-5]